MVDVVVVGCFSFVAGVLAAMAVVTLVEHRRLVDEFRAAQEGLEFAQNRLSEVKKEDTDEAS